MSFHEITARERQVWTLLAQSMTEKEAAERLSVCRQTISKHRQSIYRKLGIRDWAALTRAAVQWGIIRVEVWR